MFTEERLTEILSLLKKYGKVKVKELSIRFQVTEDCIRKDLKQLEIRGKIQRTYGGAMLLEDSGKTFDISERKKINYPSKEIIATKAVNLIQDKDIIFLDISTINLIIAELLLKSSKNITVVTNMLEVLNILSKSNSNINVIGAYGILNKSVGGFTGSPTIDFINKYTFDKSFIACVGVNTDTKQISTYDIEDGMTKNAIINSSKENFLVIENKKFNSTGSFKFASLNDIYSIITDVSPSNDIINSLNQDNIEIL